MGTKNHYQCRGRIPKRNHTNVTMETWPASWQDDFWKPQICWEKPYTQWPRRMFFVWGGEDSHQFWSRPWHLALLCIHLSHVVKKFLFRCDRWGMEGTKTDFPFGYSKPNLLHGYPNSPIIMEVENYPKWQETNIEGSYFPLPWLWEGRYPPWLGKWVSFCIGGMILECTLPDMHQVTHAWFISWSSYLKRRPCQNKLAI